MSFLQASQQAEAQRRALAELERGGLSPEELAAMREEGQAAISKSLAQRGLLDSGLLPGAQAKLEGELALARARARAPFRLALAEQLSRQAQQPTLLGSLIPLVMQYGLKGPGGDWWIQPYGVQNQPQNVIMQPSGIVNLPERSDIVYLPVDRTPRRGGPFTY